MLDTHESDGLSNTPRLVGVIFRGTTRRYGAESATACAHIPENHERCRTCTPAFAHVRAIPAFADGVKLVRINQPPDFGIFRPYRQLDTQPFRLFSFWFW